MRKLLLAALMLLTATCVHAQGQGSGILYASDFNNWSLPQGNTPTAGMIQWPSAAICHISSNGLSFVAVKVGRPLTIVDVNPALTETVTPTAVTTSGGSCTVTAPMSNVHYNYSVRSGTAGLQEAIDYSLNLVGGAVVVLTPAWSVAGGTTGMIATATGQSAISILDQRVATLCTYAWNGSTYAAAGCGTGNASLTNPLLQTFTGPLAIPSGITAPLTGNVTGNLTGSVTGASSLNVLKAGDTMSGVLNNASGFVGPLTGAASLNVLKAGDTMTGPLNAPAVNGSVNNWISPLAFGTPSGQSATTVTATGTAGTGALTVSAAGDFVAKQGVMILHGGSACGSVKGTSCPTGPTPTVIPQGATGSTSYTYKLACIDGLGGIGVAGTAGSTSSGNATLAGVVSGTAALSGNYNRVTWTGVSNCYEVAIYRNNALISTQWSGASGTQTFNDVGLTTWTNRDLPAAPPGTGLNDNYEGILQSISGTSAAVSPNLGNSVTTATMFHDDAPLIQAAINMSSFVDIPQGNYLIRYPINYTKHASSFTNAGEIRGNVNLYCDTGDICIDATGSQNVKFADLNIQAGPTIGSSIGLYLSRDTSNGDLAQQIVTDHCSFTNGIQSANQFSHSVGGRGVVGIYNHAAEIQTNYAAQFQADRWMVLTSSNVDAVASAFSATDDRGTNSMSRVSCDDCRGAGYVFGEFENAYTIDYVKGYGLGGFLDLRHPWGFEIDGGQVGRFHTDGFRIEGKNGFASVAAAATLNEPKIWSDLYRVQSPPYASATTAQIWLNDGATLTNAESIQVDDYGGSGPNVAPLVDGVNCSVQSSKLVLGLFENTGTCGGANLTGLHNTLSGWTLDDNAIPPTYGITGLMSGPTWIKVGTWGSGNPPQGDDLNLTFYGGVGFTSGSGLSSVAWAHVRIGNQTAAPNISDARIYNFGQTVYDQIKVVATGGSTSTANGSWDIYVHQASQFAGGIYKIDKFVSDSWASINTTTSDPGSASSTIFVGTVNSVALQGAAASFTSVTVPGTSNGCAQFTSGLLGSTGVACGSGGGSSAFSALTNGTNTTAAMLVGTGASLGTTGSGTISANQIAGGSTFTGNQGNGTLVQHSSGTTTTGDCVKFDANGNTIDSGVGCGSGSLPSASDTFDTVQVNGSGVGSIVTPAVSGTWEAHQQGNADNTGVTDASTILNNETTTLCSSSTPVRIHLAAGTYTVNSSWTIAATSTTCKNLVIEGDGSGNTILQSNCGTHPYVVAYINSTSPAAEHFNGPTIRHLTIKNNGGTACAMGLEISQAALFKVEDLTISGFAGQTYATGTLGTTGSTVTGSGTTWTAAMVHGFIETTSGNTTTRAEICGFTSATSLTLCDTAFPTGDITAGASYALPYGGDGLVCDPGAGISGSPFTQYATIKDVYAVGNLIGIHAWGTTSASSAGCSRIQVSGNAGYISPAPGSRVTDSVGIWLGKHSDTWEISSPINNSAVCIVNDSGHTNWINGAKCENGGSFAPVTTCNGGVGIQACTAAWEVSSDASGNGWNTTITNAYAYKVGTVYQYDNSTGAFNSSIMNPRDLSGGYSQHYNFYGTSTCPGNGSGIPILIFAYDCNHALTTQTVN